MLDLIRTAIETELKKESKRLTARILRTKVDSIMSEIEKILEQNPRYGHAKIYGGDKPPYTVRKYGITVQSDTSVLEVIWNPKFVVAKWRRVRCRGITETENIILEFFNIPSADNFENHDFTLLSKNERIRKQDAIDTILYARNFVFDSIDLDLKSRYGIDLNSVVFKTRKCNKRNIRIIHKSFYSICKFGDETVFVSKLLSFCPPSYCDLESGKERFFKKLSKDHRISLSLLEAADSGDESAIKELNKIAILETL